MCRNNIKITKCEFLSNNKSAQMPNNQNLNTPDCLNTIIQLVKVYQIKSIGLSFISHLTAFLHIYLQWLIISENSLQNCNPISKELMNLKKKKKKKDPLLLD